MIFAESGNNRYNFTATVQCAFASQWSEKHHAEFIHSAHRVMNNCGYQFSGRVWGSKVRHRGSGRSRLRSKTTAV